MPEAATAAIFYISILAIITGMIRTLRASIEKNARDTIGIAVAAIGAAGLIVAVVTFVNGPKTLLPF